ncbi:hypothetical protein HW561_11445 [Rhodobacteraceae bacterium B1Z28]|uniref:Uncharacterized protein n=1 Tax=Ruegeria haliotis TaxID=2747601 RepID=A0ABX2PTN5_9RHOB|nr:hypothetical protein [Ruegeria haliotis]NVO56404.1 hypothetical protein [Ruegeria haliotis]
MMDTDIVDMLEDIARSSVARLSPAVLIAGDTALARRVDILRVIRGTILPRRLEFIAVNGECLAIEVNSSRVTDVFRVRTGSVPDFETEPRDALIEKLAQVISDISIASAPLELISLKPDASLEADDVGITLSEIEDACEKIDLPGEPIVSVVSGTDEVTPEETATAEAPVQTETLAQSFFDGAGRFATGRVLAQSSNGTGLRFEGDCAPAGNMNPDQAVLARFAADLAGWDSDADAVLDHPQLIVLRPSGGKGAGLAVVHDGEQFAITVHETRKLGAVVNLWTSLLGTVE